MRFRAKVSRRRDVTSCRELTAKQELWTARSMTTPTATARGTMGNLTSPVRENNSCRRLRARFVTGPGRTKATSSFLTVRRRLWITRSDRGVRTSGSLWQSVIGYRLSAIENFRTYWSLTRRRVEFYRWRACESRISFPLWDLRELITIISAMWLILNETLITYHLYQLSTRWHHCNKENSHEILKLEVETIKYVIKIYFFGTIILLSWIIVLRQNICNILSIFLNLEKRKSRRERKKRDLNFCYKFIKAEFTKN